MFVAEDKSRLYNFIACALYLKSINNILQAKLAERYAYGVQCSLLEG